MDETAAIMGFIAGLLIIGWVVLANAEASTQWYGSGDREPFPEDHLVRSLVDKAHPVTLDDHGSLRPVEDRFQSIDDHKMANRLLKDQPLDPRQGLPIDADDPDGHRVNPPTRVHAKPREQASERWQRHPMGMPCVS